jgi:hypothetical protein
MPYLLYERVDSGTTIAALGSPVVGVATGIRAGLNVRPTANVTLKAEWEYQHLPGTDDSPFPIPGTKLQYVNLQAAWSF